MQYKYLDYGLREGSRYQIQKGRPKTGRVTKRERKREIFSSYLGLEVPFSGFYSSICLKWGVGAILLQEEIIMGNYKQISESSQNEMIIHISLVR